MHPRIVPTGATLGPFVPWRVSNKTFSEIYYVVVRLHTKKPVSPLIIKQKTAN